MSVFERRIEQYVEAGFPILYLNTFEEKKAEDAICRVSKNFGRNVQILIWDGTDRVCDNTGAIRYTLHAEESLVSIIDDRISFAGPQFLILKNIDTFLDNPNVIVRLKKLAFMIHSGALDSTFIFIISPVLQIPKEIEKYVTVLEMDHLSTEEIQNKVHEFFKNRGRDVSEALEKQFATALKGLSITINFGWKPSNQLGFFPSRA